MTKVETVTTEYVMCGECPNVANSGDRNWCVKGSKPKQITALWGKIPKWCPLENKKEA